MTKNGIDVSEWQGNINWKNVQTDFCIIRAGYGKELSQKDKKFEVNYSGCKSRNIPCGAYWYSYAVTPDEAKKEAAVCLDVIKGKQFEYPIYFDIEENRQFKLGKPACSEIARAFLETIEKAGYFVGIYSSQSHLESYISEEIRKRYAVWVAHYDVRKTSYHGNFGMWQKSSAGAILGINGNVDLNECYMDYPSIIIANGLNGFSKTQTTKEEAKSGFTKGQKVQIRANTPLFANAETTVHSSRISGTYYIYDGIPCRNGRYRITTKPEFCGLSPAGKFVTGFVSVDNFG